jgi:hypothetical protein
MSEIRAPKGYFCTEIISVDSCLRAIAEWQKRYNIQPERNFLSGLWFRGNDRVYASPLLPGVYRDCFGLTPSKYPSDKLVSAGKEGRHETSAVQ